VGIFDRTAKIVFQ